MTFDRWLAVIGIVVGGVISWLISRYFYRRSDKRRIPTFVLQATKVLAEPELADINDLSVICKGQEAGRHGVSEALIYFWNSGTLPILQNEVLEPYVISLPVRILGYSVKWTRDVVGMQLSISEGNSSLTLRFTVLEPGDGAVFRLAFDGPRKTKIEFKGACLDAPKPTVLPPDPIYALRGFRRFIQTYEVVVAALAMLAISLAAGGVMWGLRRFFGTHVQVTVSWVLFSAFVLLALFGLTYAFIQSVKRMTAPYVPPEIKE
jgi:hypothetical protein